LTIGEEQDLDVERAERVEADLDRLITRRHDQRVKDEAERRAEGLWEESVRRYNARRQQELAQAWLQYHIARRRTHRHTFALLDAHHEQEIARYTAMLDDSKGDDAA
jgi:hypothetical protein